MTFNTPNYKEHLIEYFNQIFFSKKIFPYFFIYEKYTLSINIINDVISKSFKINSEKSLDKASSFTWIHGILKDFPDLTR